jgi:hypothetical protein
MTIFNNLESKAKKSYEFKLHGWLGIFLIVIAESAVIFQHSSYIAHRIGIWTTPLCWWGYLFLIDAIIFKLKGNSLISNRKRNFLLQDYLLIR